MLFAIGCTTSDPSDRPDEPEPEPGGLDPIEFLRDGTVEVGRHVYPGADAFYSSAQFRNEPRRCLTPEPASAVDDAGDCSLGRTAIEPAYQPGLVHEIPVVFHVISRRDGQGVLAAEQIQGQVDVLNEAFAGAAIRFVLASQDPAGNLTSGIDHHISDEWFTDPGPGPSDMKRALAWDPDRYLNIYTNDGAGALGHAALPQTDAGRDADGVVLLWATVGRDSRWAGIYGHGRTAAHEVGHYLGLLHTFHGGCGAGDQPYASGDLLADTAAHRAPSYDCAGDSASACGAGDTPVGNAMNHAPDACATELSAEQTNRLRCGLARYRGQLYRVVGPDQELAPTARFSASVDELTATLSDESIDPDGEIASWWWSFGDGATSTERHPRHTYRAQGTHTVSLVVTDSDGLTATVSRAVSVGSPSELLSVALVSGQTVSDLSGSKEATFRFHIDVPSGATNLSFVMAGGGDADLYIRYDAEPTLTAYDYRPYLTGSNETVGVPAPFGGRWYIMLHGFAAFSGVSLTASYTGGEAGFLLINEMMADPGTFDSNGDGEVSASADEYLELVNVGGLALELAGATVTDDGIVRFTFPAGTTLAAGKALVVFGDGDPEPIPGVQVFSAPLKLDNIGDIVTVRTADGTLLAAASYGRKGDKDQSLVRSPDKTMSGFVLHTTVGAAAGSPGKQSNDTAF